MEAENDLSKKKKKKEENKKEKEYGVCVYLMNPRRGIWLTNFIVPTI